MSTNEENPDLGRDFKIANTVLVLFSLILSIIVLLINRCHKTYGIITKSIFWFFWFVIIFGILSELGISIYKNISHGEEDKNKIMEVSMNMFGIIIGLIVAFFVLLMNAYIQTSNYVNTDDITFTKVGSFFTSYFMALSSIINIITMINI